MQPTYLTIPETTAAWRVREIERNRAMLEGAEWVGDHYRWLSNDRPVPASYFRENLIELPLMQRQAAEADTAAFLAEYRRNPPPVTDEERFEALAAFGPGVKVINMITGDWFTTAKDICGGF